MDFQQIVALVQNAGGMGVLALIVWKFPAGILALRDILDMVTEKIRTTHNEALAAFKYERDESNKVESKRFDYIKEATDASLKITTSLVEQLKLVGDKLVVVDNRLKELESVKISK